MTSHLGTNIVSILSQPTRLEVFRVRQKRPEDWFKGTPKEIETKFAAKLGAALMNDQNYVWSGSNPVATECIFEPGTAYRFWRGKKSVAVVVCFKCTEVLFVSDIISKGDPFQSPVSAKLRPDILQLTKQALPSDPEIQSLKD